MAYTVGQASRLLGVPYWRVHRAYRTRAVPEPARFNNARLIELQDLRRLADHLGVAMPADEKGERDDAEAAD